MRDCGFRRFKLRKSDTLESFLSAREVGLSIDITMKILDECHDKRCYMRPCYNQMSRTRCKVTNDPLTESDAVILFQLKGFLQF